MLDWYKSNLQKKEMYAIVNSKYDKSFSLNTIQNVKCKMFEH